jgi:hypothetical protein
MRLSPVKSAPLRLGFPRPRPSRATRRSEGAAPRADIVEIPARAVITLESDSPDIRRSLRSLREVMRLLRRARRERGAARIPNAPLELRCWFEAAAGERPGPGRARWSLRMSLPADLSEEELAEVVDAPRAGGPRAPLAADRVRLEHLAPAVVGRVLHLGPLAEGPAAASLASIRRALDAAHMEPTGAHVEIYLRDPYRTPPPRLRTILLMETGGQRKPPHPLPPH